MAGPFAIRIVGPSGTDWYLDEHGEQCTFDERQRFLTQDDADDFLAKPWPVTAKKSIIGNNVRKHYRRAGYVIKVDNVEDGE